MFGLFKRNKKPENEQVTIETAPGTQIHYHPGLVDDLVADHRVLVSLVGDIQKSHTAGNYRELSRLLDEFGNTLRGHLLKENIQLYIYLQHVLAEDEENAALMQGFRSEMKDISRAVTTFLQKYKYSGLEGNEKLQAAFAEELRQMVEVLSQRIETEENVLYVLYLPPDAYRQ